MLRLENLLVPLDFSANSDRALDCAIALAEELGAKIHLVHSYAIAADRAPPYLTALAREFIERIRREAGAELHEAEGRVRAHDLRYESHLTEDAPVDAILETAERARADLIVMGTHGRTGLEHAFLGSVAERTLRRAPCPVLILKAEGPRA